MTTNAVGFEGQLLSSGRYEVLHKLGEGGMALVYKARDRNLDADVVVKIPKASLLVDSEYSKRFTRETRALVKLNHPHIVKVLDGGEHDGVPFVVMQYLDGGTLQQQLHMKRESTLGGGAWASLSRWLEQIAAALDFIHAMGYVHRDVKPANILFDQHGHAYLSDFGIAKVLAADPHIKQSSALTGTGVVLGTPAYMAPEFIMGLAYDGRIDQYALAITVFEAITGHCPFDASTPGAVLVKQTTETPKPLHEVLPEISIDLSAAVQKGLSKAPEERYPLCIDLAKAVLKAWRDPGIQPTVISTPTAAVMPPTQLSPSGPMCGLCGKPLQATETGMPERGWCPECEARFKPPSSKQHTQMPVDTDRSPQSSQETRPGAPASGRQPIRPGTGVGIGRPLPSYRQPAKSKMPMVAGAVVVVAALGAGLVWYLKGQGGGTPSASGTSKNDTSASKEAGGSSAETGTRNTAARLGDEILRIGGRSKEIRAVAVSPDSKRALSAGTDGLVRLWDLDAGKELKQFAFDTDKESAQLVTFLPEAQRVAGGSSQSVAVWDMDNKKPLKQARPTAIDALAFFPDGKRVVIANDRAIEIWEIQLGDRLGRFAEAKVSSVRSLAVSADGKWVLSGHAAEGTGSSQFGPMILWNADSGKEQQRFLGHEQDVIGLAISPDNKRALSSSYDETIRYWDLTTGKELRRFVIPRGRKVNVTMQGGQRIRLRSSVSFSPDGRRALFGAAGTVWLWDPDAWQEIIKCEGHTEETIASVAFTADGKRGLSGGGDGTIRYWKLSD